jgi:APA family basic amino acid/polyamine antiporter
VAWGYWVSVWIGNAAIVTAFVGYLSPFYPAIASSPVVMAGVALAAIWLLTAVNLYGLREAALLQVVTTLLKLMPLLLVGTAGLFFLDAANFTPVNVSGESHLSAVTATAVLALWGFLGLECSTIPADKVRDPKRTIPRATMLGTVAVALIYISATVGVMGVLGAGELVNSAAPFAEAATRMWGSTVGSVVAAGAALAAFGALNGWVLMQGQMPLAPARDGVFPRAFGRLSKRGTPIFGLLVSSSLCTVLVATNYTRGLVGLFEFALLLATSTVLVAYLLTAASQIALILRAPDRWGGPGGLRALIVSTAALVYCCWVMIGVGLTELAWGAVLLAAGVPVYLWSIRSQARAAGAGAEVR